ncbi:septal ring lytic transglycosylase RlpA family protein [Nocardiopsis exhalans]|uniref:Probable endolytic peptidoglycan transglycosylase RlpA n=1 Tax=Nocardiopsis exhalans TaxID=163604 RepID=A0ABY5D206_9ACTN|nr:septal ring lytic transglycosylase RlpA family protein [Nocardiopsis exhalans]USY17113.1 septal ring lytic transglycosylase RlpA family protein [Nocardiopsis exhalans]
MGKHEPQIPPADGPQAQYEGEYGAATEAAHAVGPRQAAARSRSRKKRALVVASAASLTLVVGGTAAAAVIVSGGDPHSATSAAGIPQAQTQTLSVEDIEEAPEPAQDAQERSQAAAPQSLTATGSGIREEPEPEPEEEPESEAPSSDSAASEGTGQGGTCEASFYGDGFHGATTANGETFDTYGMTAAHKTLPFNTMVKVTNPNNGKSVTVRINDRGPFIAGRCLDLSTAAFDEIIGTGAGVGTVAWEVVG